MDRRTTPSSPLRAAEIAATIVDAGATHALAVPDNAIAPILAALDDGVRLLRVTREGEAFAMAAGLWLGGARPWVLLQSTGLLESGDALRGTAVRMGVPVPIIVSLRGDATRDRLAVEEPAPEPDLLRRPDVDSVAILARPTLRAWGIPFGRLDSGDDLAVLGEAADRADREQRPVAVLLTRSPEPAS